MQELNELLTQDNQEGIADAVTQLLAVNKEFLEEDRPGWEHRIRQIVNADKTDRSAKTVSFGGFRRWWAAAAIIVLVGLGCYLWMNNKGKPVSTAAVEPSNQIMPGRDGAILTLADGSQVLLDTLHNGTLTLQGGARVTLVGGVLQYDGNGSEMVYNTMSTPRGRQFRLLLPDGTAVWLNNTSSIRYPVVFTGTERHVEITGEAYFEVAKHAGMPFRVTVNHKAEVEVLGTNFNVKAYDNESNMEATLLEGAVRVSIPEGKPLTLQPGQQAQVVATGTKLQLVNGADLVKVMAWKNGLFDFNNATLEEVMRQLERWYDIEVVYAKGIPHVELLGKMTRGITLNELLVVLKELGVHCSMEGRKLVVFP
jgi:ferric-dicitrate binding protein FerR (iron transport regulator)